MVLLCTRHGLRGVGSLSPMMKILTRKKLIKKIARNRTPKKYKRLRSKETTI
jgi:hypothetical protein